jgi:homocysteine S-methyltransferase
VQSKDIDETQISGPIGPELKRGNGAFSRKVIDGEFAVTVEVVPPRNTRTKALNSKIEFIRSLADSGLSDAVDLTDGSRGLPLAPPADFIYAIRSRLQWDSNGGDLVELIPHFTGRDLNTIALQARLLGYYINRINNIIILTGDPPSERPGYPAATAVFDLDSVALIRYTHHNMNAGLDFGGKRLGPIPDSRTHFTIGASFAPDTFDMDRENAKLDAKIDAGTDYVLTQPLFREKPLEVVLQAQRNIPVIVGVMILSGAEHAQRIGQVPGINVPEEMISKLASYETPADQSKAAWELAGDQIRHIRKAGISGVYLMSPATHDPIIDVLRYGLT